MSCFAKEKAIVLSLKKVLNDGKDLKCKLMMLDVIRYAR